jgi:hypothetical protein
MADAKKPIRIDRTRIPNRPRSFDEIDPDDISLLAGADYDLVRQLVESGDEEALDQLINSRMVDYERAYPDLAGVPTRNYLDSLLGEAVTREDPEIQSAAEDSDSDEGIKKLARLIQNKVYPGLTKKVGVIKEDGFGGMYYPDTDRLEVNPNKPKLARVGTILHEYGHNLDEIRDNPDRQDEIKPLVARKAAYNRILNGDAKSPTNHSEGGSNYPTPSFDDYNWEEGDFNSDQIRSPVDIQDEEARAHHIDRNYPKDNLKNVIQKGLDGIVEAPSRLGKLRKLMS